MNLAEALAVLDEVFAPLTADEFFADVAGRRTHAILGDPPEARSGLFGPDPRKLMLEQGLDRAQRLTSHTAAATGPIPGPRAVPDAAGFERLGREYHERGHTVRVPKVIALSPPLQRFARALELVTGKPVDAEIFWSIEGLKVPVHCDDSDILIVHLVGRKRWYISEAEPGLNNPWERIGEPPPALDPHRVIDVGPGDLLYLPSGTPHTVESPVESLHLSIGFSQLTVRDAVQAVLDHFADLDRPLRRVAGNRGDRAAQGEPAEEIAGQVRDALERLAGRCGAEGFIAEALDHRASRAVAKLPALPPRAPSRALTPSSEIRHAPLAVARLTATPNGIDFARPGGHLLVHPGAAEALHFIAETPAFRIADIPGAIGDDIRIALVQRLMQAGFLEEA